MHVWDEGTAKTRIKSIRFKDIGAHSKYRPGFWGHWTFIENGAYVEALMKVRNKYDANDPVFERAD